MNDTTRQILEHLAAGRIPDEIPDSAEYADTLRRLAHYFAAIQHFTIALSNGDLSQSLQGITGPVAGGLKSLQSGLRHLTWQTKQIAAGDFSQSVDFMGDFSLAFNTMVEDLGKAHVQLQQSNRELSREIEARKRAEDEHAAADNALRENTFLLNTLLNTLPLPVFYKDSNCRYIGFNKAYEEFIGKTSDQLLGKSVFDIAPRELAEVYHAKDLELLRNQGSQIYESQVKDMRGVLHDVVFHKAAFMDSGGRTLGLIGAIIDITKRKRDEKALCDSRQQLMDIIDFLPDATFVLDNDKRVIAWNRAIEEMTGISKEEILGQGDYAHSLPFYGVRRPHLLDLLDIDDKELVARYSYVVREGNRLHAEAFAPALYGGKGAWIWTFGAPLFNTKGERIGAIETVRDITEQKRLEEMLSQQARTDQMTGVNNRGRFLELLDVEIERAYRYGRSLCVLMLDLDHFKSVNDTRGHAAGDEAIRTVTRVLQSTGIRQSDFLGRIGGEEFAVALPETDLQDAADAAERVRLQLAATKVSYASENFSITVSIGVSTYRGGDSQETLLQRADQAMYQAKQTGRDRVCLELCP
ncbi:MAG: diguanylate cyclase [Desulfuromonadales bacterium]|nr:diguanylate cyclase [Desulfuromonadales bacterium]